MLRRLKAKVQGANAVAAPVAAHTAITGATGAQTAVVAADNASTTPSNIASQSASAAPQPQVAASVSSPVAAQEQIAAVMAKDVSLHEKINLLNAFAGAAFVVDDYATAQAELEAALQLDSEDAATIRNLAITVALQGDKEKALAIAARQQPVAFMLLHAIKQL